MRAYFKNMIQAYRGTCDGLVYYYHPRLRRVLVRPWFKPRPCEATRRFGRISKNLKALNSSAGFRSDLSVYVDIHNRRSANEDIILQNWYNAFTKMMWALAARWAGIPDGSGGYLWGPLPDPPPEGTLRLDLETLTRDFVYEHALPCVTVKNAVEAGLLAPLKGYELLTREM